MLEGIHFLLTYKCPYECDHCFLHCGPDAQGTFTLSRLRGIFKEIRRIESVSTVYFEGGEPFLFYPLMLAGLRMARRQGLAAGIVTNCYWSTTVEDATLWLKPLVSLGVTDLSVSDDAFHGGAGENSPAKLACAAATRLRIPCDTISIAAPVACDCAGSRKGEPVTGGRVKFRGRAAERLADGLPLRAASSLRTCPYEDLADPERVHIDCYGNVHLCQGLSMGNCFQTPLSDLVASYTAASHPICGPLLDGGPAQLAMEYGVDSAEGYVDECHCCYSVRKKLMDRFPDYLTPRQVYGGEVKQ